MRETKFTPEPWVSRHIKPYDEDGETWREEWAILDSRYLTICLCFHAEQFKNGKKETEANMNLIAVAPKMYKLLDEICSKIFDGTIKNEDARKIENLLKEAGGE